MSANDAELDVASLLRLVVLPAVEQVLTPGELETLSLGVDAPEGAHLQPAPGRYWLSVRAAGEVFRLSIDAEPLANVGLGGMREHVADELRTFVAESHFGWGQDR